MNRSVLDLDSHEPTVRVRHEVEGRVLGDRDKHEVALLHEIGMSLGDAQIALDLRVMGKGHAMTLRTS
jgi:hypothetical protein